MNDTHAVSLLYSGDDLASAYDRTVVQLPPVQPDDSAKAATGTLGWTVRSALRHAARLLSRIAMGGCREVLLRGHCSASHESILARYVGTMSNFPYLIDTCFPTFEVIKQRNLAAGAVPVAIRRNNAEDLLLIDTESPVFGFRGRALRVPPWVKQRAPLAGPWSEFIASLPRDTRKEISRCLRKYRYQGRINRSVDAYEKFYREFYLPHAASRFADDAKVATEAEFQRYRAGTQMIEVLHDDEVVAANIIRIAGNTMWGLWRGFSRQVEVRGLKKVAETADYFSLLYAACRGVTRVDFGRSRPRLNDGSLMYKAKWQAEVFESRLRKPCMLIVPRNFRPATAEVLAGSHWIVRHGSALEGVVLFDKGCVDQHLLQSSMDRHRSPGIRHVRVCAVGGFAPDVDAEQWARCGVRLLDLSRSTDALGDYLGS